MLRKRPPRGRADGARSGAAGEERELGEALAAAIGWLARRDLCSAELAERLSARGHEAQEVRGALEELTARHYLDDERYTRQFITTHAARGQGPLRIARELASLGVAGALIEAALRAHAEAAGGWGQLAAHTRRRRFGAALPAARPEWARQARFLQYRGFCTDDIRAALGEDADDASAGPVEPD